MKAEAKSSFIVFLPLIIGFALVDLFLLPSGVLMFSIGCFETSFSLAKGFRQLAWSFTPIGMGLILFFLGFWIFSSFSRGRLSRKFLWISVWAVFSLFSFIVVWIGISIITGVGASDYETGEFLMMTAKLTGIAMGGLQVGIIFWLLMAKRILRNMLPFRAP